MPGFGELSPRSIHSRTSHETAATSSGLETVIYGTRAEPSTTARILSVRAEYLLLTLLAGLFILRGFLPAWRSLNTDFRNYYIAARLYGEGSKVSRVYDFEWFQRQKDHQGIEQCLVGFVPDTVLSAMPILPLAALSPLTAKRCWLVINVGLVALSTLVLMQITQLGWRRILIVILLAIDPLAKSFLYGQMHLLVFFLLTLAVWLSQRNWPTTAGVSVAGAAALKLYPAIFLLFFLRKKRWRALAGLAGGLIILAVLSVYLFGWEVHRIYLVEILPRIGLGENIDPYATGWNSLTALLHRLLIAEPELNPHPLVNLPSLYGLVHPLCQAAIFVPALWLLSPGSVRQAHENLEWAVFATMLIAFSTNTASYHLCLLILAAALALDALLAEGRHREACILMVLYGTTCLPWTAWGSHAADGWHILWASPRVYPLLALLFFLYWIICSSPTVQDRLITHRQETWVFSGIFLLLATGGALQALHHMKGEFDNYSSRLLNLRGSLLKGEPAVGAQGLYFTRMPGRSAGFESWYWSRGRLDSLPPAEDEFHPTTAPGLADLWVELVGPVSRIVRLSTLPDAIAPTYQTEVENGEEPSVSPDGTWLAFVREDHGRGGLWVKRLARGVTSPGGEERKVVEDSYDVWEGAFEPGNRHIIFTADLTGQPELYSLDLLSSEIAKTPIPGPARYPAFSPDGQWLAYSRCERGSWHLYVRRLGSTSSRRLTHGECNSISPVWEADSKSLIYATDGGRGLNMTALARITVPTDP
jgi:Glycosyltransferase family 87/WD40-like Beta Propeller Repeat